MVAHVSAIAFITFVAITDCHLPADAVDDMLSFAVTFGVAAPDTDYVVVAGCSLFSSLDCFTVVMCYGVSLLLLRDLRS